MLQVIDISLLHHQMSHTWNMCNVKMTLHEMPAPQAFSLKHIPLRSYLAKVADNQ